MNKLAAWARRVDLGAHLVLLPLALLVAFPFFWMLGTSLKTPAETLDFWPWPDVAQWRNYAEAWTSAPFGRWLIVSAVTAGSVTAGVVLTALLAGYAFGSLEWRGRGTLFAVFLGTMMVPFEVILIPDYLLVLKLGWVNTFLALIVPWAANVFSVFLVTQAFRALPSTYREAAMLDGCGHGQFLVWVGAPLVAPALATAAIFAFLGSWNALLWPLVVIDRDSMRTLEMGLSTFLQQESGEHHLLMAASTLTLTPVLIVFLLAQRRFIEGLAAGLKG